MSKAARGRPRGPSARLRFFESALRAAALCAYRHPIAVLVVAGILALIAGDSARRLRIDTDLTHLLPSSFESVRSLDALDAQSDGIGYVSVVLSGADQPTLRGFADELAPELEALPSIRYVEVRRPTAFFRDRALYYMDVEDLEVIRDRIEARRHWEVREQAPLYDLGLDDDDSEPAPSLDFTDLREKYGARARRAGVQQGPEREPGQGEYFESVDRGVVVLLARPSRRSSDFGFNERVVTEVRQLIRSVESASDARNIRVELSGRYVKKADQKLQIERDLSWASLVALVLMVAYLGVHFRRLAAVGLVLVPLVLGLAWTFGLAAVLFGSLNLLTGFIGAMLLGLGVDHGIHLLARYDAELADLKLGTSGSPASGDIHETAVRRTFGGTGRAVMVAALTTIFAFVGVASSEFRAFREFGVLAAVGLVLIVLSFVLVLPALLSLSRGRMGRRGGPSPSVSPFAQALPRWAPLTAWLSVLVAAACAALIGNVRFDYDFASLEDADLPAFRLDKEVNRVLGRSQTPLVAIAETPQQERIIAETLRDAMRDNGDASAIAQVLSLDDMVPRDVEAKALVVRQILLEVQKTKPERLDEEQRARRAQILELASAKPFGRDDLPHEVRRQMQGRDGQSSFVLVYPRVSLSDGTGVRALADEVRALTLPDGAPVRLAGEAMVLADVLHMVVAETPVVLGLTAVLVIAALLLLLGRSLVLPCVAAAAVTLAVTAGLMTLLGLRFNYLNIVMLPVFFGMAVDGAVHVLTRHQQRRDIVAVTTETGRAVAGAILTTMLGFAAFVWAHHPGLASLGKVALLGLAVNLLVSLVALPSMLALLERARRQHAEEGTGRFATRLAVTLGLAGDSPVGPGTLGALLAVPLVLAAQTAPVEVRVVFASVLLGLSLVAVAKYLRHSKTHDPSEVVIDELVGCLIAMLMAPQGLAWVLAAFVLFRLFDIVKPWPIGFIDRRVSGTFGVVGDDVAAGVLAGGIVLATHQIGLGNGWWA